MSSPTNKHRGFWCSTAGKGGTPTAVLTYIRSVIDSGAVSLVRLTEVFRQATHSRIITHPTLA